MVQMNPNYTHMTSSVNEVFTKPLVDKYGYKKVVWPIILIKNAKIHSCLYEVNSNTKINSLGDNRPASKSGKKSYFINYLDARRQVIPSCQELEELVKQFHKRPSWNGKDGVHSMKKLINAADDLDLDYWMVVVIPKKVFRMLSGLRATLSAFG